MAESKKGLNLCANMPKKKKPEEPKPDCKHSWYYRPQHPSYFCKRCGKTLTSVEYYMRSRK